MLSVSYAANSPQPGARVGGGTKRGPANSGLPDAADQQVGVSRTQQRRSDGGAQSRAGEVLAGGSGRRTVGGRRSADGLGGNPRQVAPTPDDDDEVMLSPQSPADASQGGESQGAWRSDGTKRRQIEPVSSTAQSQSMQTRGALVGSNTRTRLSPSPALRARTSLPASPGSSGRSAAALPARSRSDGARSTLSPTRAGDARERLGVDCREGARSQPPPRSSTPNRCRMSPRRTTAPATLLHVSPRAGAGTSPTTSQSPPSQLVRTRSSTPTGPHLALPLPQTASSATTCPNPRGSTFLLHAQDLVLPPCVTPMEVVASGGEAGGRALEAQVLQGPAQAQGMNPDEGYVRADGVYCPVPLSSGPALSTTGLAMPATSTPSSRRTSLSGEPKKRRSLSVATSASALLTGLATPTSTSGGSLPASASASASSPASTASSALPSPSAGAPAAVRSPILSKLAMSTMNPVVGAGPDQQRHLHLAAESLPSPLASPESRGEGAGALAGATAGAGVSKGHGLRFVSMPQDSGRCGLGLELDPAEAAAFGGGSMPGRRRSEGRKRGDVLTPLVTQDLSSGAFDDTRSGLEVAAVVGNDADDDEHEAGDSAIKLASPVSLSQLSSSASSSSAAALPVRPPLPTYTSFEDAFGIPRPPSPPPSPTEGLEAASSPSVTSASTGKSWWQL